ncbi:hypothetical protein LJ753_03320 [Arthrobacter sp. zg-Y20]|uniref:hypothetical protein n=1 Tax=unclassified Arthrobacter TaxID=235627 RepID=UPI001D15ADF4|nr:MULTISPECIES: hypothetical protein [unclassified Arthrobacter]MCC3274904.1 hypothetical protein [Arthrobacter sp. zg-Y20]MDK1315060.1 hypothetical protein [Arthrobacter sp. zg.Y20]WIB04907.1 hypothetical protein QNO06_10065 [Arthrobacter sp. zg-Y20]
MKRLQDIDTMLRSMDAANEAPDARPQRAQADLEHILAGSTARRTTATAPATVPAKVGVGEPARAGRNDLFRGQKHGAPVRRRRAVVLGGLAAAATAGLLVLPSLSGGDAAFATWTANPVTLSGADLDEAAADCMASNKNTGDGMYAQDLAAAEVAIAERRGEWMTVVLTGADGFEATCITDGSAPLFDGGMIGSIGRLGAETDPAARSLAPTQLGTGMIRNKPISIASGRAGDDVVGVTYTSIAGEEVAATVFKGHFALWLPGAELQDASGGGTTVNVTYRDGTTGTQELSF